MKTRIKKSSFIFIVISLLLITLIGFLVYSFSTKNKLSTPKRMTFYTNYSQLVGGACGYYEYTAAGKRTGSCVEGAKMASDMIPAPSANVGVPEIYQLQLMKIDADVHTETKSLSPSTPTPQYKNYNVIVIDKVYSSELVNVSPTPNVSQ